MIVIRVKSQKVQNMLSGYQKTIPETARAGIRDLAQYAARTYILEARRKGIQQFRGRLFHMTRAEKQGEFHWVVKMPIEGVYLDRMRTHAVALKRGRLITAWAASKGIKGRYVTVHAHPFINTANTKIYARTARLKAAVHNTIQRKGR